MIDAPVTIAPVGVAEESDLYTTSAGEMAFEGRASPRQTTRVLLNGEEAAFDRGTGTWQKAGHGLAPGLNVITVRALDAAGRELSSASIRVRSPASDLREFGGTLAADYTLSRQNGPFLFRDTFTVPAGVTLTIEPGAVLLFAPEARLVIGGRLLAEGTETAPIALAGNEDASWGGITLTDGSEHRLAHITWHHVSRDLPALLLVNARATGSHLDFSHHEGVCISLTASSVTVEDSFFPQDAATVSLQSRDGLLAGFPLTLARNRLGPISITQRPEADSEAIVLQGNDFRGGGTAIEAEGSLRVVGNDFHSVDTAIDLSNGRLLLANGVLAQVGEIIRYAGATEVTLEQLHLSEAGQLLSGPPSVSLKGSLSNCILHSIGSALPRKRGPTVFSM